MGIKNILIITIVLTFSCLASDFNYKEYETSWGHFYDLFPLFITTEEIDNVAKSKIMNSNILALISYKAWKDIREIGTHPKKEKWWLDRYCLTINPDRFNPKMFLSEELIEATQLIVELNMSFAEVHCKKK